MQTYRVRRNKLVGVAVLHENGKKDIDELFKMYMFFIWTSSSESTGLPDNIYEPFNKFVGQKHLEHSEQND